MQRVELDVLLVIVLGGAIVLLKQRLIRRNRQPLMENGRPGDLAP